MGKKNNMYLSGKQVFFRTVLFTAAAIILIVIGYFTAGYLTGGI